MLDQDVLQIDDADLQVCVIADDRMILSDCRALKAMALVRVRSSWYYTRVLPIIIKESIATECRRVSKQYETAEGEER